MKKPIGIFDSGVGGLTVYKAIREAFPEEDLVYFGDTARVPYGPKSSQTIIDYSIQNSRFLLQRAIKILVVACNTSSAVAIPALKRLTDIPIIGVIEPGANQAIKRSPKLRIGIIGTEGTIRSEAYKTAIQALMPNSEVFSHACPLFVPLVEESWQQHHTTDLIVKEYLSYFDDLDIDTLVLGCTHYPLLRAAIQRAVGEHITLVDSADAIAEYLKVLLPAEIDGTPGTNSFYVSDSEAKFSQIAARILGHEISRLKRVRLFESWFED
ncbi:MAG: glutamate racemase [Candidatus Cloacimonadaceae bacterium]|nr:glutamate racemase [Candidatus Cloacimonadaceae bacterium]MDP3114648.1 glutamate racemase [Candidatus Cloacimonadaceae bacterium]